MIVLELPSRVSIVEKLPRRVRNIKKQPCSVRNFKKLPQLGLGHQVGRTCGRYRVSFALNERKKKCIIFSGLPSLKLFENHIETSNC